MDEAVAASADDDLKCEALYEKGLIYENHLKDGKKSEEIFNEIVTKYAEHPLAQFAANRLGEMLPKNSLKSGEDNVVVDKYEINSYPNPFNPSTTISYSLPQKGEVVLKIYNSLGQEVKTLVNDFKEKGIHKVNFDASDLPSGVYIYSIQANDFHQSKKMILLK